MVEKLRADNGESIVELAALGMVGLALTALVTSCSQKVFNSSEYTIGEEAYKINDFNLTAFPEENDIDPDKFEHWMNNDLVNEYMNKCGVSQERAIDTLVAKPLFSTGRPEPAPLYETPTYDSYHYWSENAIRLSKKTTLKKSKAEFGIFYAAKYDAVKPPLPKNILDLPGGYPGIGTKYDTANQKTPECQTPDIGYSDTHHWTITLDQTDTDNLTPEELAILPINKGTGTPQLQYHKMPREDWSLNIDSLQSNTGYISSNPEHRELLLSILEKLGLRASYAKTVQMDDYVCIYNTSKPENLCNKL